MRVLFVCRANVGRSQAAAEFYNQLMPGYGASAGTIVSSPGQKLSQRNGAVNIIKVMNEHGSDMSSNQRTQVTEPMLNEFDKVVVMAEPETIPDWLANHPKVELWTVKDAKNQDLETTRIIALEIKKLVHGLHQSNS
jgi:protein-tyrosine-phosphatase